MKCGDCLLGLAGDLVLRIETLNSSAPNSPFNFPKFRRRERAGRWWCEEGKKGGGRIGEEGTCHAVGVVKKKGEGLFIGGKNEREEGVFKKKGKGKKKETTNKSNYHM